MKRCDATITASLAELLSRYGLNLTEVADKKDIPGSYWGAPEAGLVGNRLLVRKDTPLHSALHEACHFICMDDARRAGLHTDAGGDTDEENAVCYLQILLAAHLPDTSMSTMMVDMDAWGYSFRLGSTCAWFEEDAEDACRWLRDHGLIDDQDQPSWQRRQ